MKNNDNFYICLAISIAIHLLAIYTFLFGLPHFSKKYMDDQEQVITFEILVVSDVSNVQNQQKQTEKSIKNEEAKQVQKTKSEPLEEKRIEEEKSKVESKAEVIIKEKEKPKITEIEKKKPEEKPKVQEKEIKKKIPNNSDLELLLKTLEQSSKGDKAKSDKHSRAEENNVTKESKGPFNALLLLSISERNLIKQHIQKHWIIPIAAQNIEEVAVTLYITLNKDGSVAEVKILEKICPNISSSVCQALADSAQRAVWQASPIQNLLPENHNKWKEFNLSFYPRDIP